MAAIIKKGTNASCFRLSTGKVLTFEPDILRVLNDDEFKQLMKEYGSFIKPRIITESKPNGCFIVSDKNSYSSDMNKEVGEVEDNSSRVKVKKVVKNELQRNQGLFR